MFDLIEYNKSHETDTPIRNKWFKFFKLDESKLPEYEPEILPHGNEDKSLNIKELRKKHGFFKGQKDNKKSILFSKYFEKFLAFVRLGPII